MVCVEYIRINKIYVYFLFLGSIVESFLYQLEKRLSAGTTQGQKYDLRMSVFMFVRYFWFNYKSQYSHCYLETRSTD